MDKKEEEERTFVTLAPRSNVVLKQPKKKRLEIQDVDCKRSPMVRQGLGAMTFYYTYKGITVEKPSRL